MVLYNLRHIVQEKKVKHTYIIRILENFSINSHKITEKFKTAISKLYLFDHLLKPKTIIKVFEHIFL